MNSSNGRSLLIFLIMIFGASIIFGTDEKVEPLKIGNFALPSSQQPGPLIGFGQNMLDKGDFQFFNYVDFLKGRNKEFTEMIPTILYGFTQDFSMYLQAPIALKFQEDGTVFRGIQDILIQFEYSFYNKSTLTDTNQISLVTNITLTPDSVTKNIRRGLATTNFFLGFTASHMGTSWYPFMSLGTILATRDSDNTKYGNQLLYECGLSQNIFYVEDKYIINWMLELDGFYKQQDTVCGLIDPNSGSNTILFGPSLWFSSQRISAQAGISWVIFEKLLGVQNPNKYYIAIDIGWKF
jgi:hypothetical protein